MRIGERAGRWRSSRGLGYLGLLMLLAMLGAALGEAGVVWRTQAQREREAELRFRGEQIRVAIQRYRAATPGRGERAWPPTLEALLEDRRGAAVRHHLRQLWRDPFTGAADWELLPAPGEPGRAGIAGVRSRSAAPRLSDPATLARGDRPLVSDWRFEVAAPVAPASGRRTAP